MSEKKIIYKWARNRAKVFHDMIAAGGCLLGCLAGWVDGWMEASGGSRPTLGEKYETEK